MNWNHALLCTITQTMKTIFDNSCVKLEKHIILQYAHDRVVYILFAVICFCDQVSNLVLSSFIFLTANFTCLQDLSFKIPLLFAIAFMHCIFPGTFPVLVISLKCLKICSFSSLVHGTFLVFFSSRDLRSCFFSLIRLC